MRVPYSWLTEYVAVDAELDELLEVMGRNGLEIEEVRRPGAAVSGVRVARVLAVDEHPDADKLVVVRIDDGDGERTVCAGARNIAAGDLVPYAAPGAVLPDPTGDPGNVIEIGRREMRGVVSDGMLCSPMELQVAADHSGIMVLDGARHASGGATEAGVDIHEVLPIGEPVLDVAVPADRGDLQSVFGVARDLAAILGVDVGPLDPPERARTGGGVDPGPVPVAIEAAEGCSRYVGWVVEGLTVGDAPWWMRRRLEACGVRSLGNLVDITNYVMLERGQPLHAFDLDRLAGPEIAVRWASDGEPLRTLDGRDRHLEGSDLVIADAERAVALAGVMGGEETEVEAGTARILLESAAFAPTAVRRTSRRLGLVSEASMRFERGVDPEGCVAAAARAVQLLAEHAGGGDAGAAVSGPGERERPTITLDTAWCARFLGLPDLDGETQAGLLRRAHVDVSGGPDELRAAPPSWRRDLQRPADLAEEVARLHGYERIPAELPPVALRGGLSPRQRVERDVRAAVLAGGFHEAQTSPFVAPDALMLLLPGEGERERVPLENPLAKDTGTMRPSLAEGLLAAARRNVGQGRDGLALAEIGRIFRAHDGVLAGRLGDLGVDGWHGPDGEPLPAQPRTLGLVAYGFHQGERWLDRQRRWSVPDLLATVGEVVARIPREDGRIELDPRPATHPVLHPGRTALLAWSGTGVGIVGQLHPREAERRDLPEDTVVGEVLLEPLWAHLEEGDLPVARAGRMARHPATSVDVAVVIDEDVPHAVVEAAVREGAGAVLDRLRWFDEYRGEQVGEGRRSLAFTLRLHDPERQLTDADADAAIEGVEAAVAAIGGTLRR